jgi:type I restriction enzyme, S subunit
VELVNGYQHTEIGIIPREWDCLDFGTLFQCKQGVQTPIEKQFLSDSPNRKRFIRIIDLTDASEPQRFIEDPGHSHHIYENDLFMVRYGTPGLIGFNKNGVIANNLFRIIPRAKISSEFYFHYLRTRYKDILEMSGSSTMPAISFGTLANFKIIKPGVKEQEAIANALSDADAYIESLEKLIAKKRLIKKGVMQELLTGKRRLEGFNGKWITKSLGEIFQFGGGYSASRDDLSENGYPYLHYGDIHTSNKNYINLSREAHIIPKLDIPLKDASLSSVLNHGDVVFVDASEDDEGTSKHVIVYNPDNMPFISGLHTIVAKSRSDDLEIDYRRFCFQNSEVKKQFKFYAVGTKVSGISKTNIAKINLTFPERDEQKAIADFLVEIEQELEAMEEKLKKARLIKQGMMQELLTGRIRLV